MSFVVLEGPERLVIYGSHGIVSDVSLYLPKLSREVQRYRPDVLILEEAAGSMKGERVREHLAWSEQWATDQDLKWRSISRETLQDWSAHLGSDKQERALMLTKLFPELQGVLPPPRMLWQSQDPRLNIFVALTRGLCHYELVRDGV